MESPEIESDYLNPLHKTVQITAVFVFFPTGRRTDRIALHLTEIKVVSVETNSKCNRDVTKYI